MAVFVYEMFQVGELVLDKEHLFICNSWVQGHSMQYSTDHNAGLRIRDRNFELRIRTWTRSRIWFRIFTFLSKSRKTKKFKLYKI